MNTGLWQPCVLPLNPSACHRYARSPASRSAVAHRAVMIAMATLVESVHHRPHSHGATPIYP